MSFSSKKPVVFLAFANDQEDSLGYLRNLPQETRRLRQVLQQAEESGHCELVVRTNCTASDIFEVFQSGSYRDRIAIFHYGGHANGYQLLLESNRGTNSAADAQGFAEFLAQQASLQLVFLNGCSTKHQTRGLLDANVAAVISTSSAIEDSVATDFAFQFYQGLAGGGSIQKSFLEAEAAARTTGGGSTRGLFYTEPSETSDTIDRPWGLYVRTGAEQVREWNLPEASNDPLFGLPSLPDLPLPDRPFRHLDRFTREDAEIFFGRGAEIRRIIELVTDADSAKVIMLYGQSGVGKSSLLDAGVNPRLEATHGVKYLRRSKHGWDASLQELFGNGSDAIQPESWLDWEQAHGLPLVIILDQVEEAFIHATEEELHALAEWISSTLITGGKRPAGKLILAFRKEWLAEIESILGRHRIARSKVHLKSLEKKGVIEAIVGPVTSPRLAKHFGLSIEADLANAMADDLLADHDSALAPTLQILLTKLWENATQLDFENPRITVESYQTLKRRGLLLRDFLAQQLEQLRGMDDALVTSGLALDLLAIHTTSMGTANQLSQKELVDLYPHVPNLEGILRGFQDLHLLSIQSPKVGEGSPTTRLAHDTLAPLVRERFEESDKPGQRARRILDARSQDWENDRQGAVLDDSDLATVEDGLGGTRTQSIAEASLIRESSIAGRRRSRNRGILRTALVLLFVSTAVGLWLANQANRRVQSQLAETKKERNRANDLAVAEEESRKNAEAKTAIALRQAADATMQRAFTARDYENHPSKASVLFAKAAEQYRQAGLESQARSALIANETQIPRMSIRHPSSILDVELSSDHDFGIIHRTGLVQIWNLKTGKIHATFEPEVSAQESTSYVHGVKFLQSNTSLALVWTDEQANLINLDGECIETFKLPHAMSSELKVAPDGSSFLSYDEVNWTSLRINRLPPLRGVQEIEEVKGVIQSRFVSLGDEVLVVSNEGEACTLWSVHDGRLLRRFEHPGILVRFALDQNEETLVTWRESDVEVRVWDFESGTRKSNTIKSDQPIYGVRLNADGSKLVTWDIDSTATLWDLKTGLPIGQYIHTDNKFVEPTFCGIDGELLVTFDGQYDRSVGTLKIWDLENQALVLEVYHDQGIVGLDLSTNGKELVVCGRDGQAQLWDIEQKKLVRVFMHDGWAKSKFTLDGQSIVTWSDDRVVRLWKLHSDSPLLTIDYQEGTNDFHSGDAKVAWSKTKLNTQDNSYAVFSGLNDYALLWSRQGPVRLYHSTLVVGGLIDNTENKILTWDDQNRIRSWILENGNVVFESEYSLELPIKAVKFFRGGKEFLVNDGKTIWQYVWGAVDRKNSVNVDSEIIDFRVLNDEEILFWNHESVHVWEINEKQVLQKFDPDPEDIYTIRGVWVDENRRQFVTALEGELCLWEVGKSESVFRFSLPTLMNEDGIDFLTFDRMGKRIFASHSSGLGCVWHEGKRDPVLIIPPSVFSGTRAKFLRDGRIGVWTDSFVDNKTAMTFWKSKSSNETNASYQVTQLLQYDELSITQGQAFFSAGENFLLTGDSKVTLWHCELNSPILEIEDLDFLGKVSFVLMDDDQEILVWDTNGKICLWRIPDPANTEFAVLESEVRNYATVSDSNGSYRLLLEEEWQAKFNQLAKLKQQATQ